MAEILTFIQFVLIQAFGIFIAIGFAALFLFLILRRLHCLRDAFLLVGVFLGIAVFLYVPQGLPNVAGFPVSLKTFGPGEGPILPLKNIFTFFRNVDGFERVANIARNPNDVSPPLDRTATTTVHVNLEAKEVIAEIAPGITFNYWTFNGTVPGPFIRVREGDTVELTLTNSLSNLHHHNIDLHAVTGPGGGATLTNVAPGETKTMSFKALQPGLYVYHCAHENTPSHVAHGMYGLILVEPEEGLPDVDREFYVMQGELYTTGALGKRGLQIFDGKAMVDGRAQYVVFNGRPKALAENMVASVGERVRLYVGNGGVNYVSSFHVIGEIFDTVYPEGGIGGALLRNIQTTLVPAGGATIVEFGLEVPGEYTVVDHALARIDRGAWGVLRVEGEENPEVYSGDATGHEHD